MSSLTATHFQLGHEASDSQQMDENCVPHVSTPGRSEDFLLIPGGTIPEQNLRATYFCGDILDKTTVVCKFCFSACLILAQYFCFYIEKP